MRSASINSCVCRLALSVLGGHFGFKWNGPFESRCAGVRVRRLDQQDWPVIVYVGVCESWMTSLNAVFKFLYVFPPSRPSRLSSATSSMSELASTMSIPTEKLSIRHPASDGFPLAVSIFRPTAQADVKASVVFANATGVQGRFYHSLASWLSKNGVAAYTLDYRFSGHPSHSNAIPPNLPKTRTTLKRHYASVLTVSI